MVFDPARPKSLTVSALSPVDFKEGGGWLVASSESGAFNPCPECISSDRTADEIKRLSTVACEQVINSEECRGVNPKYLRDCEAEEDSPLAFGQRVLGCMKGAALEGAIGLGVGAVLGKVIVGIGALLSVPVVGSALGIAAGGGAALYVFSEYDRAYQEVGEGEGRAMRAMGHLLGEVGTGVYRLLLGNYECYSSEGRAWEVCGLLLGGVAGGGAALATVKKAAKKAKSAVTDTAKRDTASPVSKNPVPAAQVLTKKQEDYLDEIMYEKDVQLFSTMVASFRRAGISMGNIRKAANHKNVGKSNRNGFNQALDQMEDVKKAMGQAEDLTPQQVYDAETILGNWRLYPPLEAKRQSIKRLGLSVDDIIDLRRKYWYPGKLISNAPSVDRSNYLNYLARRESAEKAMNHRLTPNQDEVLDYNLQKTVYPVEINDIEAAIQSGLSHRQLRTLVDEGVISTERKTKQKLRTLIRQHEESAL